MTPEMALLSPDFHITPTGLLSIDRFNVHQPLHGVVLAENTKNTKKKFDATEGKKNMLCPPLIGKEEIIQYLLENLFPCVLSGKIVLHDNVQPHAANATQECLVQYAWEDFDHPLCSPDLDPGDYKLFFKLKEFLGVQRFGSGEELGNVASPSVQKSITW
ncbi:histone-lysine N-methyltransferase SETMAR [Trichonephila clavipes]|nr:histone-lysine N-methyltransferase SETMAR [Trichonephila clavipes]